jgi:hypothetical protein
MVDQTEKASTGESNNLVEFSDMIDAKRSWVRPPTDLVPVVFLDGR